MNAPRDQVFLHSVIIPNYLFHVRAFSQDHNSNQRMTGLPPQTEQYCHLQQIQETDMTDYDRKTLIEKWQQIYGSKPPKGLSRTTLELAIRHHAQARKYGGLPKETQQHLLRIAREENTDLTLPQRIKPGARLVREWNGQSYVVDILESGYLCQEKIYKSLSEIAREITGTRWSGPRFFGLRSSA